MKRPDFDEFREIFLSCLSHCTGREPEFYAEIKWTEVGGPGVRQEILEVVRGKLRENYGIEFEVNYRLLSVGGSVESAVIQTFHELNTIFLIEKINAKIRSKRDVYNI